MGFLKSQKRSAETFEMETFTRIILSSAENIQSFG
jgi:hypothetical protein